MTKAQIVSEIKSFLTGTDTTKEVLKEVEAPQAAIPTPTTVQPEAAKEAGEQFNKLASALDKVTTWETEKTSLIEAHTKALNDVTAKLQTEAEAKATLTKAHEEAVLKLNEQHKQELAITDEKINQAVTAKLNNMNLSEGDLPADQKANPEVKQRFTVTRIA